MESMVIWAIALVISFIILIPYLQIFSKQRKRDKERFAEARRMGIKRPLGQYPFIDQGRCIGCGSCIVACPEGDVLGIVFGKATIINGLKCVGHGYCQEACPVSAIEVGLGNIKERDDIPILDKNFQTSVPGLYIAGELSGISLIRNAINHGKMVVNAVSTMEKSSDKEILDLLIVGFGPAGLSAALQATSQKLNYLVIDQQQPGGTIRQYPRQKLVMTQTVDIPLYGKLSSGEHSKEKLISLWEQLIMEHKIPIKTGEKLEEIERINGHFTIKTSGNTYRATHVLLALGRRGTPRKLGVPGEELEKVLYRLTDAQSYQNKHLLIVGGGDSAVEAAIGLARQPGNRVTISYRKEAFFRIKQKNM